MQMNADVFPFTRKSHIRAGEVYFWTATINQWQKLLLHDEYKEVIIRSLEYLTNAGKVDVYAFVIMPNHIHFIWRIKISNGKESAHASFLKYTAHEFRKMVFRESKLDRYKVDRRNKKHEFWQRDSLAIRLYSRKVALQKLNYIHNNPCSGKWSLCEKPYTYLHSSARFYDGDKTGYTAKDYLYVLAELKYGNE